jgi:hypothetical protein
MVECADLILLAADAFACERPQAIHRRPAAGLAQRYRHAAAMLTNPRYHAGTF